MRIISFIENRDQPEVVEKILKHCDIWREPEPRAPPKFVLEHEYISTDEFLADFWLCHFIAQRGTTELNYQSERYLPIV